MARADEWIGVPCRRVSNAAKSSSTCLDVAGEYILHLVAISKVRIADDPDDLRPSSIGARFGTLGSKSSFTYRAKSIWSGLVIRLLTFDVDGTLDVVTRRRVRQEIIEEVLTPPHRHWPEVMVRIAYRECRLESFLLPLRVRVALPHFNPFALSARPVRRSP
jgi:hypothetical protein